jgi:hypothetical protein
LRRPQQFYDVASAAAEDKDVSGEWLLKKNGLHLRTQTIETSAHVGDAGCDPDLRSCGSWITYKDSPEWTAPASDQRRSPR